LHLATYFQAVLTSYQRRLKILIERKKLLSNSMKCIYFLMALFLSLLGLHDTKGQENHVQIKEIGKKDYITVKKGSFIQCIQETNGVIQIFSYGRVKRITCDEIILEANRIMPGSGGVIKYHNILNIEKVRVVNRAILPSIIFGGALAPLYVAFRIPILAVGPIVAVSTSFILAISIRKKNKKLFQNRVGESVILITPKNPNSYFETN
jgi:hypothetical protein